MQVVNCTDETDTTADGRSNLIFRMPLAEGYILTRNIVEKALIPLPPTGFAFFFCAKVRAVQTPALPRPAAGAGGVAAIARSARFCKKSKAVALRYEASTSWPGE